MYSFVEGGLLAWIDHENLGLDHFGRSERARGVLTVGLSVAAHDVVDQEAATAIEVSLKSLEEIENVRIEVNAGDGFVGFFHNLNG